MITRLRLVLSLPYLTGSVLCSGSLFLHVDSLTSRTKQAQACRIYEMAALQDTEMDDVDDAEFDQSRAVRLNEEEGLDEK